jgi:thymidylate kinase
VVKRPAIVAFLGIHGSGKTTQGRLLYGALRQQGIGVEYVHQLAPQGGAERWAVRLAAQPLVAGLQRVLNGDLGKGPEGRRNGGERALRRAAATATAARGVFQTWLRVAGNKASLLIFDRYAYDGFIRARWWYGVSPAFEALSLRLVPVPDILFYLEAAPELAWRRHKGQEWSLEQLVWQEQVYRDWLERLRSEKPGLRVCIVPGGSSIEDAHRQVAEAVFPLLGARSGFQSGLTS